MSESFFKKFSVVFIGAFICSFLWGSAFPFIKLGYDSFSIKADDTAAQILFAGIRFTLAGILAVIIACAINKKPIFPKKKEWKDVCFLSFFQTIAQYILFYIGLAHTTGVKASIVEGMNVFVAIFVSAVLFRMEKLNLKKVLGCMVGFAGVVLINVAGDSAGADFSINFLGDGFVFLSTVAYAFSSVLLKHLSKKEDPVMLSGYQFIVGGLFMMVCALFMGGSIADWTGKGIAILVYLAFVSAVAYSLWGVLLKNNPVSRVAVFGFMNPMIGFILSAIMLDEGSAIRIESILAILLVCIGIIIVNGKFGNNDAKK